MDPIYPLFQRRNVQHRVYGPDSVPVSGTAYVYKEQNRMTRQKWVVYGDEGCANTTNPYFRHSECKRSVKRQSNGCIRKNFPWCTGRSAWRNDRFRMAPVVALKNERELRLKVRTALCCALVGSSRRLALPAHHEAYRCTPDLGFEGIVHWNHGPYCTRYGPA